MPQATFYPLGNADSCLIDLINGKKVLFDYAATRDMNNPDDKRIDLAGTLRSDLESANKGGYEITAFTHLDDDHTCGADGFFHLNHSTTYQGEGRATIETLWVPAGVITESRNELKTGAKAIQAEARYRLKQGYGIRVFSRPAALKEWLEKQGLTLESRQHLITDAGQLAPELSLAIDGVEFFVHSPFAWRQDASTVIDRNRDSLVMQATFMVNQIPTRFILGSDVDWCALTDIVKVTKYHGREERLLWDILKLMHHCSYLTLGPDRGVDKTIPVDEVKWLFETQGQRGCIIVSCSDSIPAKNTTEDKSVQPPHRQAANYYRDVVSDKDGEFVVTMEHPKVSNPKPVVIEITGLGGRLKKPQVIGAAAVTGTNAPRAGRRHGG
jgi:hypothetical protein